MINRPFVSVAVCRGTARTGWWKGRPEYLASTAAPIDISYNLLKIPVCKSVSQYAMTAFPGARVDFISIVDIFVLGKNLPQSSALGVRKGAGTGQRKTAGR